MPRRQTPLLEAAVTQFLAGSAEKHDRQTFTNYRSLLRRFSTAMGQRKRVGQVTSNQVQDWLYGFVRAGRAPGTVNAYRGRMLTFNRWCLDRRYTTTYWLEDVGVEPDPPRDWTQLAPDELLRLLDAAHHPRDRCMVALEINTGLRINEITKITVGSVNLSTNRLRVVISKQRARRETVDYMPITSDLHDELITWLAFYQQECGPLKDDWFLTPRKARDYLLSVRTGEPDDRKPRRTAAGGLKPQERILEPQPILRRIFTRAGLPVPPGETWHVLRRSVALIYFQSRMDSGNAYEAALRQTAALLHHKSMQTTERYLGFSADRKARDADLSGKGFLSRLVQASSLPRP